MIVKKLESPVYYQRKRESLPGMGAEAHALEAATSFDQYLLDAFNGEVVQQGSKFSSSVSSLTRENLIRLSQT